MTPKEELIISLIALFMDFQKKTGVFVEQVRVGSVINTPMDDETIQYLLTNIELELK